MGGLAVPRKRKDPASDPTDEAAAPAGAGGEPGTAERRIDWMPLAEVLGADSNPREHDIPSLRRSINRFGFVDVPELDERTGQLVAGHGRLAALTEMRADGEAPPAGVQLAGDGGWLVPIQRGWASRSDAEAMAYLVGNNRHTELARWHRQGLAELLVGIREDDEGLLEAAGYVSGDVDDLVRTLEDDTPPQRDDDDDDTVGGGGGSGGGGSGDVTIAVKVPHHVFSAWQATVGRHNGDAMLALASLLQVDPRDGV